MHICHFSGSCPGSHYAKPRISTPTSTFPLAEIFPSDHFSPGFAFVNATDSNSGVLCWLFQWLWKSHKSLQCHAELGLMPLIVYLFIRSGLPGCSLLLWPLSCLATILQPMSDELHWKMINWEKELYNFFLFFWHPDFVWHVSARMDKDAGCIALQTPDVILFLSQI